MNFFRGYWKSIVVCVSILYLSVLYTPTINVSLFSGADKVIHLLMYLILGATLTWDSVVKNPSALKLYLVALLFPMVFGGAMELIQHMWIPQRAGDIWDIVANCLGVLIGFRLVIVISSKF